MPSSVVEYGIALAILAWAFKAAVNQARWLGGGLAAYVALAAGYLVSAAGPVFAIALGAGGVVAIAALVAPATLVTIATRRLVELGGHLRPEVSVFESYRRIDRVNRGEAGAPKMANANAVITIELERLEKLRVPATDRLVDAIGEMARPWVAGERLEESDWLRRKKDLWAAAEDVWGPHWTERL